MIHCAKAGSIERFVGVLVEHYAGAFPMWLAPVQVSVIPVADRHHDYARSVAAKLRDPGLRVEVDDSEETVGEKIRRALSQKHPAVIVVGDQDVVDSTVGLRLYGEERDTRGVPLIEATNRLVDLAKRPHVVTEPESRRVDREGIHIERDLADSISIEEELDSNVVGPYRFPSPMRRRIAGWVFVVGAGPHHRPVSTTDGSRPSDSWPWRCGNSPPRGRSTSTSTRPWPSQDRRSTSRWGMPRRQSPSAGFAPCPVECGPLLGGRAPRSPGPGGCRRGDR